jgi:hypothetical protein
MSDERTYESKIEMKIEIDPRNIAGQLTRQHGIVYNMHADWRPQAGHKHKLGPSMDADEPLALAGMQGG